MSSESGSSPDQTHARWQEWQSQLAELGGANPLRNFEANSWAQIDLTKAHPGGLAQFVSTSGVRLSNLVRDPLALNKAVAAAGRIHAKSRELSLAYGVDSSYLVGGLASLQGSGFDLSLPILMWPVSITEIAGDYQISKTANPMVNPELVTAFKDCFDVKIDERKLLGKLDSGTDLVPMTVLEYLSDLGSEASELELKRILTVANFVPEISMLQSAARHAESESIALLLGAERETENAPSVEVQRVCDLDQNQLNILAKALKGDSFAVETLPGCGYTQTVAALLVNLALQGKRTLVTVNRMQTADEIANRLTDIGFAGLLARQGSVWLDVVAGIARHEKAKVQDLPDQNSLAQVVDDLHSYQRLLNTKNSLLGVSILECFTRLAALAAMPHAPTAQARIPLDKLVTIAEYQEFIDLLFEVQALGVFGCGPSQSAWYGARFASQQEIENTLAIARRLRDETFPQLSSKLKEFISSSEFAPANSVSEWGRYLRLFTGLRETLDKLKPEVFDRPLDDLIEATAARKSKVTKTAMSGRTRRRLKKLAKEFVRPGMVVSDINEALSAAKWQKEQWAEFSTSLKPPAVPNGINDALVSYQALVNDLHSVQSHLHHAETLVDMPVEELALKLKSLCEATEPLHNYFEKADLVAKLAAAGLAGVVDDFARLNVKREHLVAEFDQVWWQSALELQLAQAPDFISFDADRITELESKFMALDASSVQTEQNQASAALANSWSLALKQNSSEVELFRSILKSGKASLPELLQNAPNLLFSVSSSIAVSALQVENLLARNLEFDCLLILDAGGTTVGENLAALARGGQVIAFGDQVISVAAGFETEPATQDALVPQVSALREIADRFSSVALRTNYRSGGQLLGALINREFYQNRIQFEPTTSDYFGHSKIKLDLISDGSRAPSSAENAHESLDSEVIKTVELVFNHAVWHPQDSLLVATASDLHCERIRSSISSGLKSRPDLQTWFDAHGDEKFEVATISKLRHRIADRVIFSIGFGKSQHGAILSNFGNLSSSDGRRALANLLVSARKELHVVSCFSHSDLAKENLADGAIYLRDLLADCSKPQAESYSVEPNPLLEDLALRLRKLGVTVKFGFGQKLDMIASYGNQAMVLVADWALMGESDSERYRLRPKLLESLGWKYQRITSFEVFSDPLTLAQRIAGELGISVKNAGQQSFEPDWASQPAQTDLRDASDSNENRLRSERPPHWG